MKTSPLLPALPVAPLAIRLAERLTRDLLTLGEIVPAALVATLDSGRALIQIKGRHLIAEVPFPLPEQKEFQVQVEQMEPRTVLRLLAATAAEETLPEVRLKACLAGNRPAAVVAEAWKVLGRIEKSALPEEIREAWTGFQETLKTLSGRFDSRTSPEVFKDLVNLSGLNWENKLLGLALKGHEPGRPAPAREDLKGFLLTLKSRLEPVDADLAQAISPILQKIELCQWLNASDSGKTHLLLFFPWWLPEGQGWAELLLSGDRSERGPAAGKGQSLLFLLHLPVLGKLRVEVTIRESRLYGRFKTESPEVAELLERQIPRLKNGLSSLGYQAALESLIVDPEQLGEALPIGLESFPDSLVSRVV
ncbi:MAG: flagellar hook-length control protein FliK [Deltaproteobacteria bacterium]|nr:flagellar hook-length control protein FliK [Deltaproteobacteria bacterium]